MDKEKYEITVQDGHDEDYVVFIANREPEDTELIDFIMAVDSLDEESDFQEIPESSELTDIELERIAVALSGDDMPSEIDEGAIKHYGFLEPTGTDEHGDFDSLYTRFEQRDVYTAMTPEGHIYIGDKEIIRAAVPYIHLDDDKPAAL